VTEMKTDPASTTLNRKGVSMNLSFKLTGKDWIGLYLAALVFYLVPIIGMQFLVRHIPASTSSLAYAYGFLLFAMLSILILLTPILKKFIGRIYIEDKPLAYDGKIGRFVFLNIAYGLLAVITLFIYVPWSVAKVIGYMVGKTAYNGSNLSFNGKGSRLFVLLLLSLVLPMIVFSLATIPFAKDYAGNIGYFIVTQLITFIIIIPYIYYVYKWMVDISYKDYVMRWDTEALESMGTIAREILLSLITIGIYYPVACAKLYEYFVNRTVITQKDSRIFVFKAKFNYLEAWKVIWVQSLLTIITVGIYGAWAYCKIAALFVNNTSISQVKAA